MDEFMAAAIAEARKGSRLGHGGPFGAVVVLNGRIVSRAHNEVVGSNDPTAHAETLAIRRAAKRLKRFNLKDCELYASCEPCPLCLAAVLWSRIKTVHYGATRKDAARIGFDDSVFYDFLKGKRSVAMRETREHRDECLKPMAEWHARKDRVLY